MIAAAPVSRPHAIGIAVDALPAVLAEPLALATHLGERVLGGESILAELVLLRSDWHERAAPELAASLGTLARQPAAVRRGIATCIADTARLHAFGAPFARLVIHVFAWHSAPVAAVHARMAEHAAAYARVLDEPDVLDRDTALRALEYVLAIPASESRMRRSCLVPLVRAVRPGALAAFAGRLVATSDRTVRAGFAALCRNLPVRVHAVPAAAEVATPDLQHAIETACDVLAATQSPTGSWHGDYGGPLFLLPMYIGTCHAVGLALDDATRAGMIAYLTAHQNPDGGWGLDVEGDSHVFTSVLNYVALRLLGVAADDARVMRARAWFLPRGGAVASASWGKFFLAVLGLYDYEGLAPVPPELWLLPESLPIHPSHMWCHARMVYLPMSFLYGKRVVLGDAMHLRDELYAEPYDQIDWRSARDRIAADDLYKPHDAWLTAAHAALGLYERMPSRALRARALARLLDHIAFEDRATNYVCIGPVNKLLNLLVWHHERPGGTEEQAHVAQLPAYLFRADDGVKMQGYESSELWDTTFAIRAIAAAKRGPQLQRTLARAAEFVADNQIAEAPPDSAHYYRDPSVGGWPFSTAKNGWIVTDCTASGLEAAYALDPLGLGTSITVERRADAVGRILSLQNADGGWASYERTRGPRWLERLNPSEVFGEIMIERSYVECTSACMQALHAYDPGADPVIRTAIATAIARGASFLLSAQRDDGSWEGSWGVCFTYGTWFGVCGLASSGDPRARAAIDRACAFLCAHQQADGGWGETVEACRRHQYIHAETGQAVMTSWALLALVRAGRASSPEVRRGVQFLLCRQGADGRWPPEHIAGVFNHTCAIHYDAYLRVFPLWALAAVASV